MAIFKQRRDIVQRYQPGEQVGKGQDAQHAGHLAHDMDDPITEDGQKGDAGGKNQDAGAVTDIDQLGNGLPREHRAGGAEPQVHQAHQHNRDGRAVNPELHAAGDHLRQPQFGPLCRVKGNHCTAQQLTDQQANQ